MTDPQASILMVALTRYADACPPEKHPDCPFATVTNAGRSCASQCRDEVTRLSRPGHSAVSVFSSVLFDARQRMLSESGVVPQQDWQTVSLLTRLHEALRDPPIDGNGDPWIHRHICATNALAYLGHRGFDPDWLVRFGCLDWLAIRLAIWIGGHCLNREEFAGDPTGGWIEISERYMGVDTEYEGLGNWLARSYTTGFTDHLQRWVEQAPLAELVMWAPCDVDDAITTADDGQARWMFDRFTETYIGQWSEQSLHLEYRYLRGEIDGPVPVAEMQRRETTLSEVATKIADIVVSSRGGHASAVVPQALLLLAEGRRKEAAALFDAARIITPMDSEAHNNYGFCLTPDDPAEALRALVHSQHLEQTPLPVNRINQAVALRILGRADEALACAERAYLEIAQLARGGWLWTDPSDPENCCVGPVDTHDYLLDLGLTLAAELEDEAQIELWRERRTAHDALDA